MRDRRQTFLVLTSCSSIFIPRPVSVWYTSSMDYTRLPYAKRSRIVHCFAEDVDATRAARLCLVNRKTANAWYKELRRRLLPYAATLPEVDHRAFSSYLSVRLRKFYGLRKKDVPYHAAESKLRFVLKRRYTALVLDVADEMLKQ